MGIILAVVGLIILVGVKALKKFEFETEAKFDIGGDYDAEIGFDFEIDREGKKHKKKKHNRGEQPNQISEDPGKPMLIPQDDIDMYPYYNRNILV